VPLSQFLQASQGLLCARAGVETSEMLVPMASDLDELDDAESIAVGATAAENLEIQAEEFEEMFQLGSTPAFTLMQLTGWEEKQWTWLGWRLSKNEICKRIFAYVDFNKNGVIPLISLDFLIKHLQAVFTVTKDTFDFVEERRLCGFCVLCCTSHVLDPA
jgi:hypothetical protein